MIEPARTKGWLATAWSRLGSGLLIAGAFWALWVANFNDLGLGGTDPLRPLSFLRLMFGEVDRASGYQFGLAFLWSPFYAGGKLLSAAGVPRIGGEPAGIAMIALGTSLLILVICALLVPVLRSMGFRHESVVLLTAVFGSPLLFYGSFNTGLSHAADTLLYTSLVFLLYRYFHSPRPSLWLPAAMGAVAGYAATVRLFNGFAAVAVVIGFAALRRLSDGGVFGVVTAGTFVALSAIPIGLGASLTGGYAESTDAAVRGTFAFRPQNVLLMFFSDRNGLFLWAPVTLLGVIGFILLIRQRRDERPFLALTGALALSVVLPFVGVRFWAGQGFSARYLTPVFPLVVLGLAELVRRTPRVAIPLALLAASWTVALVFMGPSGVGRVTSERGGASWLVRDFVTGRVTPTEYAHSVYHRGRISRDLLSDPVDHG